MTRASALLSPGFVLIWSSGYVVGGLATRHAPALAVTFTRMVLAAALLTGLARLRHARWPSTRSGWGGVIVVGSLLCGVQFGGIYLGMQHGMPAGTTALLASSSPLLVALVQVLVGAERLTGRQWSGALLGLLGVVIALLPRLAAPGSLGALCWTLLGLAGLVAATVLTGRFVPDDVDGLAVTAIECTAGAVVLLPWAVLAGGLTYRFTGAVAFDVGWLWLVNSVGGTLGLLALVRRRGATRASSLMFAVPSVTAVAAWPVLGQPIGVSTVLGLAVAAAGITLVQRRPAPARPSRPAPARPLAPTMGR